MPTLFRADRAGSTNAVIHWNITGRARRRHATPTSWSSRTAPARCRRAPDARPEARLTVGPVDFLKVVTGNANPVMMFMTGKLKAKGDLGLAANIANLFDIPKA